MASGIVVFAAIGLMVAVLLVRGARRTVQLAEEPAVEEARVADMRTVPLVRLGSITGEMLARVTGTAMPRDALVTAPLSGQPCIAYRVELYIAPDGKVVREAQDSARFRLEGDGANAVVVGPAPIVALGRERLVLDSSTGLPDAAVSWIDESFSGDWRSERVRLVERRIEVGDRIAVVGWARTDFDDEAVGYHDAGELVMFVDEEGAPLSLSDDASLFPCFGTADDLH